LEEKRTIPGVNPAAGTKTEFRRHANKTRVGKAYAKDPKTKMLTDRARTKCRFVAYAAFVLNLLVAHAESSLGAPIALAWIASTNPIVAGYNIYYGSTTRNYTNVVSAGGASTVTVSNLLAGSTYYFAATAYTADGLESAFSSEAVYAMPTAPIVRAAGTTSSSRSLTVFGLVGNNYQVQYSTNLGPTGSWYPLSSYSQTNVSQTISLDPTIPQIFYRVQQK
jgi:hypothetical protein